MHLATPARGSQELLRQLGVNTLQDEDPALLEQRLLQGDPLEPQPEIRAEPQFGSGQIRSATNWAPKHSHMMKPLGSSATPGTDCKRRLGSPPAASLVPLGPWSEEELPLGHTCFPHLRSRQRWGLKPGAREGWRPLTRQGALIRLSRAGLAVSASPGPRQRRLEPNGPDPNSSCRPTVRKPGNSPSPHGRNAQLAL
ncbi:hypothetical protein AGIG_G14482 [Arapaima gigas]